MEEEAPPIRDHPWERKENPQTYELMKSYGEHPNPAQHMLGVVGGNEVPYKNRMTQVDTESDLRGITRPLTFCASRKHSALPDNVQGFVRINTKGTTYVPVVTKELNKDQMWGYPATLGPQPLTIETCIRPEKY